LLEGKLCTVARISCRRGIQVGGTGIGLSGIE
jgi:hypothetical protein